MKHLLLKLQGHCDNESEIRNLLFTACDKANAHIRNATEHIFFPVGYSLAIILAESHVTVHTWTNEQIMVIDYFSCAEEPNFDIFEKFFVDYGFSVLKQEIVNR